MAPPRKRRKAGETHPIHLRLPIDVFQRIEAEAKKTGSPFNREVINELAEFPRLKQLATLGELIGDMEVILARYGSRSTLGEINEALVSAVDEMLASRTDGEQQRGLDKLRVLRAEMLKLEQTAKGGG
jgi:hypothetical protein